MPAEKLKTAKPCNVKNRELENRTVKNSKLENSKLENSKFENRKVKPVTVKQRNLKKAKVKHRKQLRALASAALLSAVIIAAVVISLAYSTPDLVEEDYIVSKGDTLWKLYTEHCEGVKWDAWLHEMISINELSKDPVLLAGDRITLLVTE